MCTPTYRALRKYSIAKQVVFQGTSIAAATGIKLTYGGWRGGGPRPELSSHQRTLLPFLDRDENNKAKYLPLKDKRNTAFRALFAAWAGSSSTDLVRASSSIA